MNKKINFMGEQNKQQIGHIYEKEGDHGLDKLRSKLGLSIVYPHMTLFEQQNQLRPLYSSWGSNLAFILIVLNI